MGRVVPGRSVGGLALPGGGSSSPGVSDDAAIYGLVAHTLNPAQASGAGNASAGFMLLAPIFEPGVPIGHLGVWLANAGVTATGRNGMAIYTIDGATRVGVTGDMSAAFTAADNRFITGALAGGLQTPQADPYWLAVLTHCTTNPKLASTPNIAEPQFPSINGVAPSIFFTGIADFPASFNPALAQVNAGAYYMAALV